MRTLSSCLFLTATVGCADSEPLAELEPDSAPASLGGCATHCIEAVEFLAELADEDCAYEWEGYILYDPVCTALVRDQLDDDVATCNSLCA